MQAGLKLTMFPRLASDLSQSPYLSFLSPGMIDAHHHTGLIFKILLSREKSAIWYIMVEGTSAREQPAFKSWHPLSNRSERQFLCQ